jgi:hypothetical protein
MDHPVPTPAEAHRPERVPLSEEQKQNYQKDIDRFEEEKFASRNSFPTKLLGWLLIAGFGLQVAGASHDFGGLLVLFAGISVLKGSQSALRFITFLIIPAAATGILAILWSIALHEPLEVDKAWRDYSDLKFWTLGISPCMYFVAEAIVAVCAFRLRKILFWTKTVRVWAAVFGIIFLVQFAFFARDLVRQREVQRSMSKELAAAKAHFSAYGRGISSASMTASEQTFSEFPNVLEVDWKNAPNSTTEIYRKRSPDNRPSARRRDLQEWLKLPSGEWGMIEMKVVLPKDSK